MATELITHSRTSSFKSCRKKHFWEYECGIRPITDARALRMGNAGHAGLEWLHTHPGDIDGAAAVVRATYGALNIPETEELASARDFECETIVALVAGYAWRWAESPLDILATEQSFRLPLVNPETGAASKLFELAGKIDGIVKLEDGRLAVREHKFLSDDISPESDFWRRLQLDHQITLYVHAARRLCYDVATVLYDVVRKPTIRPEKVPILDENDMKIVLDRDGHRVRNASKKATRSCLLCGGDGTRGLDSEPCDCTLGPWRQTSDSEKGYVLQARPMTCDEWIAKLMEDIGERPGFYYARQEIPRLDQDIQEFQSELWDIQMTIREAQRGERWYRTVSRDTCSYCPFFGLCTSKFDPSTGTIPEGFVYSENRHPELGELSNGNSATATQSTTEAAF
jgi:hypothetical protein